MIEQVPSKIHYARFPVALYGELRKIADAECRTISSIINQAVKELVERRGESGSKKA